MRPLRLEMEGFGPYLHKTTIDFTILSNGLTLITGNTGAGKTTIFDAICCALYGDTSGSNRKFSAMRSKHATADVETKVKLVFELKGKEYTVERSPGYDREKKRGEGTTKVPARAVLTLPDNTVITKTNDVTNYIKEILGIGKTEFSQIMMIAQNEFMAMLDETGSKQVKIFKDILKATIYSSFDDELRAETEKYRKAYSEKHAEIVGYLTGRHLVKEDLLETEELDLENLKDSLTVALQQKQREKRETEKKLKELNEKLSESKAELERLNQLEKKFSEKEQTEESLEHLKKEEDNFIQLKQDLERAYKVRDNLAELYSEIQNKRKLIQSLKSRQDNLETELFTRQKNLKIYQNNLENFDQKELDDLKMRLEFLEKQKPTLREIEKLRTEKTHAVADLEKESTDLEEVDKKLEQKRKELESLKQKPNSDFLVKINSLTSQLSKVQEDSERLKQISDSFYSLREKYETQLDLSEEIRTLKKRYVKSSQTYDLLFNTYIDSQAAFLADNLVENEPCPVCGSTDHPAPAKKTEASVSLEEVDEAKKIRESIDKEIRVLNNKLNRTTGSIESESESLKILTKPFEKIDFEYPATLETNKQSQIFLQSLNQESKALKIKKGGLEKDKKNLEKERRKNEKNIKLSEQLSKEIAELTEDQEELKKRISANNEIVLSLDVEIKVKSSDLEVTKEKELNNLIEATTKKVRNLEKLKDSLRNNLETAKTELDQQKGEIKRNEESLLQEEKNLSRLSEDFMLRLKENGLKDLNDFKAARMSPKDIKTKEAELEKYRNKKMLLNDKLKSLEAELKNKERPDLDTFNKNIEELEKRCDALSQIDRDKHAEVKILTDALHFLSEKTPELLKLKSEYETRYGMNEVVNNRNSNFAQFVLSFYFRMVIDKANVKLAEMTGRRYQFKQPKDGKLEIEIFDAETGTQRDVKTLSGGETFMASLTLALGLSEIIEEQSGGIRCDTIFIDEGFGSLDPDYLEKAVDVLSKLSKERDVNLISHVEQLKERIHQQIIVDKTNEGSRILLQTQ